MLLPCISVINLFSDGESQMWKIYDVGGSRTQVTFLSLASFTEELIYYFVASCLAAIL